MDPGQVERKYVELLSASAREKLTAKEEEAQSLPISLRVKPHSQPDPAELERVRAELDATTARDLDDWFDTELSRAHLIAKAARRANGDDGTLARTDIPRATLEKFRRDLRERAIEVEHTVVELESHLDRDGPPEAWKLLETDMGAHAQALAEFDEMLERGRANALSDEEFAEFSRRLQRGVAVLARGKGDLRDAAVDAIVGTGGVNIGVSGARVKADICREAADLVDEALRLDDNPFRQYRLHNYAEKYPVLVDALPQAARDAAALTLERACALCGSPDHGAADCPEPPRTSYDDDELLPSQRAADSSWPPPPPSRRPESLLSAFGRGLRSSLVACVFGVALGATYGWLQAPPGGGAPINGLANGFAGAMLFGMVGALLATSATALLGSLGAIAAMLRNSKVGGLVLIAMICAELAWVSSALSGSGVYAELQRHSSLALLASAAGVGMFLATIAFVVSTWLVHRVVMAFRTRS